MGALPATAFSVRFARELDVDQLANLMTGENRTAERDGAEPLSASGEAIRPNSNARRAASSVLAWLAPKGRAHQGLFSGKRTSGSSIPMVATPTTRSASSTAMTKIDPGRQTSSTSVRRKAQKPGPCGSLCAKVSSKGCLTSGAFGPCASGFSILRLPAASP